IIVAGDGAGANVHILAQLAVTHVAEMVYLAALADAGLLHFHEVADACGFCNVAARADAGKRPDVAARADARFPDDGVGVDHGPGADLAITQEAVRADAHVVTQHDAAVEDDVDVDFHVASKAKFAAYIEAARIAQAEAGQHEL